MFDTVVCLAALFCGAVVLFSSVYFVMKYVFGIEIE